VIRVDDRLREYIEKNSFKNDVIETDFELLMGTITGLEEKNGKLEKQLADYRNCQNKNSIENDRLYDDNASLRKQLADRGDK